MLFPQSYDNAVPEELRISGAGYDMFKWDAVRSEGFFFPGWKPPESGRSHCRARDRMRRAAYLRRGRRVQFR